MSFTTLFEVDTSFADEPTANPDRISSTQILELFRDVFWDMGHKIRMATYEPVNADSGTRAIVFYEYRSLVCSWSDCQLHFFAELQTAISTISQLPSAQRRDRVHTAERSGISPCSC